MSNGPPEDQLQHQAADRAGGVPLQQVPEAGQAGARRRWTFGFRADARSGTRTHPWTPAPPGPVCTSSCQASHRCLSPPPLDADRRSAPATFTFRSGQINPSCRLAELVWIVKSNSLHRAPANETNKIILIGHKDEADCLFMLNFFSWIDLFWAEAHNSLKILFMFYFPIVFSSVIVFKRLRYILNLWYCMCYRIVTW